MKIIVGDETGLLKIVSYEDKKVVDVFGNQDKNNAIKFISFVPEDKSHIFALSKSNILSLYKNGEENKTNLITSLKFGYEKETSGMNLINGRIILTNAEGESFVTQLDWTTMEFTKEENIFKSTFNQINNAKSNTYDKSKIMLLTKDSNPSVLDIENKKIIWKARNVKNDYLDLKVPVNDLDVAFQTQDNCYVSTAYHKIRLYDLKKSNSQPVLDIQHNYEDSPFNKILISPCSNYIFVSNFMGSIFKFDTRKNLDLVSKFKGASGSIEDICLHPSLPFLGVVGLDRYLRIYNLSINKMTYKIYMKRKLTTCLFNADEISSDIVISDEEDFDIVEKSLKKPNDEEIKKKITSVKKHRVPLSYTSFPKDVNETKEEEEKVGENAKKKVKTN